MRRFLVVFATAAVAVTAQLPSTSVAAELKSTSVVAQFPAGKVKVGQKAPITGAITGADRTVKVQVKTSRGWLTVSSGTSQDDGTFAVAAPTYWAGTHSVRVYSPSTQTHQAATSPEGVVKAQRTYKPRKGTAWSLLSKGNKARWDPCGVIRYKVNRGGMPKAVMKDVRGALKRISAATGLRFVYAGTTKYVPLSGKGRPNAALTVAWATPKKVPALAGSTIGRGGAMWYTSTTGGWHQIVNGYAVLDSTWKAKGGFGTGHTRGALLLHELGHAIGLGHVGDSRQIMGERLSGNRAEFAKGDLRGLSAVGASNGCF